MEKLMCLHMPISQQDSKIREYLNRWRSVTAHTAADILVRLNCGDDVIDWGGFEKSPSAIAKSIWFANMRAKDVGIFRFMGGPPGHRRLIKGTLLMLLVDRLLFNEALVLNGVGC
jgi:hypothetical protein